MRCDIEEALIQAITDFITSGADVEVVRKAMYCQVNWNGCRALETVLES